MTDKRFVLVPQMSPKEFPGVREKAPVLLPSVVLVKAIPALRAELGRIGRVFWHPAALAATEAAYRALGAAVAWMTQFTASGQASEAGLAVRKAHSEKPASGREK